MGAAALPGLSGQVGIRGAGHRVQKRDARMNRPPGAHLVTRLWHRKHDESPSTGTGSSTEVPTSVDRYRKGQRPTEPDLRHEVQTFIRL